MADEKKIIIDEDWKAQVQAEKEAAAKQEASELAEAGVEKDDATAPSGTMPNGDRDPQMPPASFEMLVTTLATEALMALGQVPHPATNQTEVQRNHAQYLIDTLDVLRQKTNGNLTPQEQQLIDSVLHQVRMLFVAVTNESAGAK